MSKQLQAVSESGFQTDVSVGDHDVHIDAGGEASPDTIEGLLAHYAACYVPALRVGGEQRGVDDLGQIDNTVEGEVNDDGKLTAISFDITVDADVSDEKAEQIVDRANALCKVHDALKTDLHADVSLTSA